MKRGLIIGWLVWGVAFGQFAGGSGSGYTRGAGGGVLQCNSAATIVVHACDSYTLPSGSRTVNVPGTYLDTIPNLANCDSLLTIQLSFSTSSSAFLSQSGCDSLSFNGITYTSSGTYTQFLTNTQGCDSVLTLFLGIQPSTTANLVVTSCGPYQLGGQTFGSSGTYHPVLTNHFGCDSLVTLQLTVLPFTDSVALSGNTLTALQTGATYQWLDCNNGFLPIAGQTAQNYTPAQNGSYCVAIDDGSCRDTSRCTMVIVNGLNGTFDSQASVFPNPTMGAVTVKWVNVEARMEVMVLDLSGRVLARKACEQCESMPLDLPDAPGLYLLQMRDALGTTQWLRVERW